MDNDKIKTTGEVHIVSMQEKDVLDAGYQKYRDIQSNSNGSYQKRILDDPLEYGENHLYLNLHRYDLNQMTGNHNLGERWEAEFQFYKSGEEAVRITLFGINHTTTLSQVEENAKKMYGFIINL